SSGEGPRGVDAVTPQLAPLPEAVVDGVVAEPEEDAERHPDEGERQRRQRDVEPAPAFVQQRDEGRDRDRQEQARPDPLEDAAPDGDEVLEPSSSCDEHVRGRYRGHGRMPARECTTEACRSPPRRPPFVAW